MTHEDDGSIVVRAVGDCNDELPFDESWEEMYDHMFPMDKIEAFLKNMQCRIVTGKAAPNLPLMLEHPLGGSTDSTSYIRFLVAHTVEDVDD